MPRLQDHTRVFCRINHLLAIRQIHREWFFAQHMLARLGCLDAGIAMIGIRGADTDRLKILCRQQLFKAQKTLNLPFDLTTHAGRLERINKTHDLGTSRRVSLEVRTGNPTRTNECHAKGLTFELCTPTIIGICLCHLMYAPRDFIFNRHHPKPQGLG